MRDLDTLPSELNELAEFLMDFFLAQENTPESVLKATEQISDVADELCDLLVLQKEKLEELLFENEFLKKQMPKLNS